MDGEGTQPVVLWALAGGAGGWEPGFWRMEIALFHYRFVIAAALPLYLSPGIGRQILSFGRWAVVAFPDVCGSVRLESFSPRLIPSEIRRGVAGATRHVSDRWDSSRDSLWCSSGLIEGLHVVPPLSSDNSI